MIFQICILHYIPKKFLKDLNLLSKTVDTKSHTRGAWKVRTATILKIRETAEPMEHTLLKPWTPIVSTPSSNLKAVLQSLRPQTGDLKKPQIIWFRQKTVKKGLLLSSRLIGSQTAIRLQTSAAYKANLMKFPTPSTTHLMDLRMMPFRRTEVSWTRAPDNRTKSNHTKTIKLKLTTSWMGSQTKLPPGLQKS